MDSFQDQSWHKRDDLGVVRTILVWPASLKLRYPQKLHSLQIFIVLRGTIESKFQEDVRNTVAVLYDKLQEIWKRKKDHLENTMTRYVGTREGLFIQMSGVRYPHPYDHTKRIWYVHPSIGAIDGNKYSWYLFGSWVF